MPGTTALQATVLRRVPHGLHVAHPHLDGSVGVALVWDIADDGKVALECDCGLTPVELAVTLGIPLSNLLPIEIDISRTMLSERIAQDGADPDTLTLLATLERAPARRGRS